MNQIIGKEETLEDGSIIKNLNTIKSSSDEFNIRIEQLETNYADEFKDIRDTTSNALISLLTSISNLNSNMSLYSNDGKLEEEEKSQIESDISNIMTQLTNTTDVVNELTTILNSNNQDT